MSKLKLAVIITCSMTAQTALAFDPGNISLKSGGGEELTYKKGLLGSSKVVVKDRIGNKYEKKKGMFGSRSKEVSLLGNKYKSEHGLLGDKAEGRTFFGDTVTVKKGKWGRRSTEVDLSGVMGVVKGVMGAKEPFADAPAEFSSADLMNAYKGQGPVNGNELNSMVNNQDNFLKKTGPAGGGQGTPKLPRSKDSSIESSMESSVDYMHAPVGLDPDYQWGAN